MPSMGMGRKPIPPSQRAQPISFSLKPHLIAKIDDYCLDHRFNRSKFLQEAVTTYMLRNDMGYNATSDRVMDMTIAQRVAVGLAALQEANREGLTISKAVMDNLRNELSPQPAPSAPAPSVTPTGSVQWFKIVAGDYAGYIAGEQVATVQKQGKKWVGSFGIGHVFFDSLKEAKSDIQAHFSTGGV